MNVFWVRATKSMPAKFVNIKPGQALLLPPDMREWVPEDCLVHFIVDAVAQLDLAQARMNERGTGSEQYPPLLLLALLVYSYASGVFSSRQIERATYDSVAVRVLCADTHPGEGDAPRSEWDRKRFSVEDFATGFVHFDNGATLTLEASWLGHQPETEDMSCQLFGTKGGVK